MEPAQELVLTEAQAKGEEIVQLRYVVSCEHAQRIVNRFLMFAVQRFTKVSCLSVFIVDNQGGDDVTRLDSLDFFGEAGEACAVLLSPVPSQQLTCLQSG